MKKIIIVGILTLLVTPVLVYLAYQERGYLAFGGEYLLAPFILIMIELKNI